MSSILDFLREDFSVLEKVPKKDLDDLTDKIKSYRLNPNKSDVELNYLIAETSHFYYSVGKKIAQVQSIKFRIDRKINRLLYEQSLLDKITFNSSNKDRLDGAASYSSDEYEILAKQYDECVSMETYLKSTLNTLFMEHYALRNEQTQPLDHNYQIKH